MTLRVVPVELETANAVVAAIHRHHVPAVGHRFSLGAVSDGVLVGAAIVGRPVARMVDHRRVVEVVRLATDGTHNACSILYAAAARAARAMGYERIQTYTLPSEGGASLRASGWECEGEAGGGSWVRPNSPTHANCRTDQPMDVKYRWSKQLNPPAPDWTNPHIPDDPRQTLWEAS